MSIRGYRKPLYILPFDHRGSFETGMFGWKGALTVQQTAQIADAKQIIYEGLDYQAPGQHCYGEDNRRRAVDEYLPYAFLSNGCIIGSHFHVAPFRESSLN